MARGGSTGVLKVYWVPDPTGAGTVVTKAAPTSTQVNTGTRLDTYMRRDGLTTPNSGSTFDVADVSSPFNSTAAGTYGGDAGELKLYRDLISASDTMWPLMVPRGYGFLIVFRFSTATSTPAAGDKCEVYQVQVTSREMAPIAENEAQWFTARLAFITPPNDAGTALV